MRGSNRQSYGACALINLTGSHFSRCDQCNVPAQRNLVPGTPRFLPDSAALVAVAVAPATSLMLEPTSFIILLQQPGAPLQLSIE